MIGLLQKKPWLLIVLAFVFLILAWVALILIAEHNTPAIYLDPAADKPQNQEEHAGN